MRRAHQTFCEAPADGAKFYLQVTGKRFFAKGVAYNPRNEPLGITKRTSGLGFSALPLDHCSRPGTISTTLGQAFNSLVGWTSASLENQREVPPVDLAETTWGGVPFCSFPKRHMGHLGGYRGYSADVQTDALEEYWSADLEARLGKTLPALSRLSLDFVVFLPQDSCIVSLV